MTTDADRGDALPSLPPRDPGGHKGTFGTVAVVGGSVGDGWSKPASPRMIGGPALSALAALRAGAGLVRLVMPEPVLSEALVIAPGATGLPIPVDDGGAVIGHEGARVIDEVSRASECLAIGPGLGAPAADAAGGGRFEGVGAMCLRAVAQDDCPVVVDADALNNLAGVAELRRDFRAAAVLTPHPGEYRRLARSLGLGGVDEGEALDPTAESSRRSAAEALAQTLGCVVVLKGSATVVSDGHETWVNETPGPNAALGTAGTGDVLTGLLAAIVAQFHPRRQEGERASMHELAARALEARGGKGKEWAAQARSSSAGGGGISLFDCARVAVRAHALAGWAWREGRGGATGGLLATDLVELIPATLERMRG